ncbi:MAG: methyltetrahydrofolate cobalamin methyltransferase [Defluviitaleaceae bacterium]|nr:methyltetrahydrofolate cobalamin methyltransferase [Defluviitaleaceae bacterium]
MIIVGEKLNSTLKAIRPAMESRDEAKIIDLAKRQTEAGASYIDLNAAMFGDAEVEIMEWLVNTVQGAMDTPLTFDSPNPEAIKRGLKVNKNPKPMINSITAEKERFEGMSPILSEYEASVIALCMDDSGMPETADDRFRIAESLINDLTKLGMKLEDIYIDPMVRPVGTGSHYGIVALDTIRSVKQKFPEVHIMCGLSNISFGLPARKLINQVFLVSCLNAGMDGAILDPLDKKLMSFLYAGEAVLGLDDFCVNYLEKFREDELVV